MTKQIRRFIAWTALVAITCICAGAAAKVFLDTLASRNGWHWGGEVLGLLALAAMPLEWLCRKIFQCVMAGGIVNWR